MFASPRLTAKGANAISVRALVIILSVGQPIINVFLFPRLVMGEPGATTASGDFESNQETCRQSYCLKNSQMPLVTAAGGVIFEK